MGGRITSPVFVGRERELVQVDEALATSRRGEAAFVLVSGEAGVGKTRFIQEVGRRASVDGSLVLEGGCVQLGGDGLPLGPVVEAFRTLPQLVAPDALEEILGSGRPDLSRIIPALAPPGAEPPDGRRADGSSQGRLFEHLLGVLDRIGRTRHLVLLIEDIHWIDASTLALLNFLGRNLRRSSVLVIATYRDDEVGPGHPLLPFLAAQARAGRALRLGLNPFNRHELAAQLTAIRGVPPSGETVEAILARSNGNPFYSEELARAKPGDAGLPASLREVLLARVATLPAPNQGFLRAASASSTRVIPALVARALEVPSARVVRALRDAAAAHLLAVVEDGPEEQYAFRHALVQEALYGELLVGERQSLHRRFADALAARPDAGNASLAAELAYHCQAAHDVPRAFDAWIRAALAAEGILALSQALAYFERALALWDHVPDADSRAPFSRIELLTRAAALAEGTDPRRSVAHIRAALEFVDEYRDPVRAGLLHERLGQYGQYVEDPSSNRAAYEEAVRLVPEAPPAAARAWVLSGLSRFYASNQSDPDRAIDLGQEALAVARQVGAREMEPRALLPLGAALVRRGDVEAGLTALRAAASVAAEVRDDQQLANSLSWLASNLYEVGRFEEAVAAGEEASSFAARHGLGARWATNAQFWLDDSLVALGRWDDAEDALGRAEQYELHGASQLVLETKRLRLDTYRGRLTAATERVQRLPRLATDFYFELTPNVVAEFELANGDPLGARATIAAALSELDRHPDTRVRRVGRYLALGIKAEADLATGAQPLTAEETAGSRSIAESLLARMRAFAGETGTIRPFYAPYAATILDWSEAEFARIVDEPDPDRWAAAAKGWDALRIPYDRAYALMREGEATLAQRRDRPRATRALAASAEIGRRLGADLLVRRVESLATRAGITLAPETDDSTRLLGAPRRGFESTGRSSERGQHPGPRRRRHDLTPRELEVLSLLSRGHSDGEIASALFISKKTASFHVATIKAKLGSRSRVEIATDAIGLGLVSTEPRPLH